LLIREVIQTYEGTVRLVHENFGESELARKHGITRYPAVFVNEALIAHPRDFYAWGSESGGRYTPWNRPDSRVRFQRDLTQMIDLSLRGEHLDSVQLTAGDAAAFPVARLPEFLLLDLEGASLHSKQWQGKVTVVEFWAPWCPPCRSTLRWLGDLHRRHGDTVSILAAAVASPENDVRSLVDEMNLPFSVVMAPQTFVESFRTITAIPTLFVFDAAGNTAGVFFGAPEDLHRQVGSLLESLIPPSGTVPSSLISVQGQIRGEIDRVRTLLTSGKAGGEMSTHTARLSVLLESLDHRADAGQIFSALQQLRGIDVQISASAFAHTHRRLAEEGMQAFEEQWRESGARIQEVMPERRLPLAVEALRQVSVQRARTYHQSALPYARADSVGSGTYYLGVALAYQDFAAMMAALEFERVPPAPAFRRLDHALSELESGVVTLFASATAERQAALHSLNASLKEARELDDMGEHAGALARLLDVRLRLGDLRGAGHNAQLEDLRRKRGLLLDQAAISGDHSMAVLYLELVDATLQSESPDETALRRAAIILEDVLSAYFALLRQEP
jgi:thiol-disulfide isomerase/thioredoxin